MYDVIKVCVYYLLPSDLMNIITIRLDLEQLPTQSYTTNSSGIWIKNVMVRVFHGTLTPLTLIFLL